MFIADDPSTQPVLSQLILGNTVGIFILKRNPSNNSVTISRSDVNATGVMYYKVETATDTATIRMIELK